MSWIHVAKATFAAGLTLGNLEKIGVFGSYRSVTA